MEVDGEVRSVDNADVSSEPSQILAGLGVQTLGEGVRECLVYGLALVDWCRKVLGDRCRSYLGY